MKNSLTRTVKMAIFYTGIGLVLQIFLINMVFAAKPAVGQDLKNVAIDLSLRNATLVEVFKTIESKTNYKFLYLKEELPADANITMEAKNETVSNILQTIAGTQHLIFKRINSHIVVKIIPYETNETPLKDISDGAIKGRVSDASSNEALIGANILIKSTNIGTTTDENGNYELRGLSPGNYTIVVKYVGYKEKEETITVINDRTLELNFKLEPSAYGFNEIVVSANLVASKKKEVSSAVTTISSKEIDKLPGQRIDELFRNGEVPGGISWDREPGDFYSNILFRGTNAFDPNINNSVKTYIDGVEVVSSILLSTLDLNSIDHIEILHGPQASTLYGAGALNGVMYIFTKKGNQGGPHINAKVSSGTISSDYVDSTPIQQDHTVTVSGGSESITYNFGGSYFHYDPYWEGGNNTRTSAFGSVSARQGLFTATLTGRYSNLVSGSALNPVLKEMFPVPQYTTPYNNKNTNRNQALGLNVVFTPTSWWQNNFSIGIDQINQVFEKSPREAVLDDTLSTKSNNDRIRKSYRYYTTFRFPIGEIVKTTLTGGIDHFRYESTQIFLQGEGSDPDFKPNGNLRLEVNNYTNTGFYGQAVIGVSDVFFLTGGIRSETTESFGNKAGPSVSPKIGASAVLNLGNVMIKPRVTYGKSIRVPDPSFGSEIERPLSASITLHQLANPDLKPEEQNGYDLGFDLEFLNGRGTFSATYYNQTVKNMIVDEFVSFNFPVYTIRYINLGKIRNKGVELNGTLNMHPFNFRFTYTNTSSTVEELNSFAESYEYEVGDHIIGVPKYNGGATVTYSFPSFTSSESRGGNVSLGITYFGGTTNPDKVAIVRDELNSSGGFVNGNQKKYRIEYPSFATFRLGVNYNISQHFNVFLNIENLFNNQKYQFDNTIPTQGRLTMLGVRVNY